MTPEEQTEFEELFRRHLTAQYNRGVRVGLKTASRMILDTLKNTSKPILDRVKEVKKFCEIAVENGDFIAQENVPDAADVADKNQENHKDDVNDNTVETEQSAVQLDGDETEASAN